MAILETDSHPIPLRSTVANVDFTHIKHWLAQCEDDVECHQKCKASPIKWRNLPGIRFKVIDVQGRRIVNAPDDCSFVALTYVWGGVNQPKLTENTAPLLMRDGGLRTIWAKIPATVRDAIEVCEKLGERYLWVDALCIMQDSVQDMKIQILRMREIYSAAKCTIAAVSGETADEGLLGSPPSKDPNSFDSLQSLETFLKTSPWSSRAWCYQEKVLSHRMILFTSTGVYMQC
ncbi:HET-domain-containing protein, partial [Thozetella sp. PMI_491]